MRDPRFVFPITLGILAVLAMVIILIKDWIEARRKPHECGDCAHWGEDCPTMPDEQPDHCASFRRG